MRNLSEPQTRVVNNTNGIGFLSLLGVLFIGLKLTGYISWSWWLVLLPLYGPLALVLGLLGLVGMGYGIVALLERRMRR
jgi:hypothetical protein